MITIEPFVNILWRSLAFSTCMKFVYSLDWMPFYNNSRRNSIALLYFGGALYKASTCLLRLLLAMWTLFSCSSYAVTSNSWSCIELCFDLYWSYLVTHFQPVWCVFVSLTGNLVKIIPGARHRGSLFVMSAASHAGSNSKSCLPPFFSLCRVR